MRFALLYTDADFYTGTGYHRVWETALAELGCTVDVIPRVPAAWALESPPRWDLVIPHVLAEEVAAFGPTMRAAALLEAAGVPMLNPLSAVVASTDKLATHAVWAAAGLPQPRTWDLAELDAWPVPADTPLVLKPSLGDGARYIELVRDLASARERAARWVDDEAQDGKPRGAALLQEHVADPRCLRIFATPDRVSQAYEKLRREGSLVTEGPYVRIFEPPDDMAALARAMVATLGGGLMGVDVLLARDGRLLALEANAPFGFDVEDPSQGRFVARCAVDRALVSRGGSR